MSSRSADVVVVGQGYVGHRRDVADLRESPAPDAVELKSIELVAREAPLVFATRNVVPAAPNVEKL